MKNKKFKTIAILGGLAALFVILRRRSSGTPSPGATDARSAQILQDTQASVNSPYRDATV